jgi:hypothetical protein
MIDAIGERNKIKALFANATSRVLLGVWLIVKGSSFSLRSLCELISSSEQAMETKLQAFAGMGLVQVTTDPKGERMVVFMEPPTPETEKVIREYFDARRGEFDAVETKLRALIYKKLLEENF